MQDENEKAVRDPIAEAIDLLEKSAEPFDKACMLLRAALQSQVSNTDVLEKIVKVADEQPFCSIGHIVEHVVPEIRDALAAPAEKREQINALRQKIIDAEKALSGDTIQVSGAEYEVLKKKAARYDYLLNNMGTVEEYARSWNPAKHKPLLAYLQDFIDAAIAQQRKGDGGAA